MTAIAGVSNDLYQAAVLAESGDLKDTVAETRPVGSVVGVSGICTRRLPAPSLRNRTAASSPLRNVAPRCGSNSDYTHRDYHYSAALKTLSDFDENRWPPKLIDDLRYAVARFNMDWTAAKKIRHAPVPERAIRVYWFAEIAWRQGRYFDALLRIRMWFDSREGNSGVLEGLDQTLYRLRKLRNDAAHEEQRCSLDDINRAIDLKEARAIHRQKAMKHRWMNCWRQCGL